MYRLAAHAKDQYITGEVYFGVPDPGPALLREAEAQLSRLTLKADTPEGGDEIESEGS